MVYRNRLDRLDTFFVVLYIDGGRVSSSNFRGIAALGAVMFKKYVCKIKAYYNRIK